MKPRSKIFKFILPVLILSVGLVAMTGMVRSKTPPEKKTFVHQGILVETMPLQSIDHAVQIHATGTVRPAAKVNIVPQVGGRITKLAKGFKEGAFFAKDQLLFEIEDADYRLAVEKSASQIAKAEYDLASVESQARVARIEWERVTPKPAAKPNPLVLYEPQLKNARASLASARADLRQRELDLSRTRVYAPFNCRISVKNVDLGQFVSAGQIAAAVAGTDAAEIVVPLPLDELQFVDVPRNNGRMGSLARVHLNAGLDHTWQGRIDRSLGEVDVRSRMIRLVVKVDDPYGLKKNRDRSLDLAEGLFVDVSLSGNTLEDVYAVPVSALRHEQTLWMVSADNTLAISQVDVLRREKDKVLVRGDLADGRPLVTTRISGAAAGMKLRLARQEVKS